MFIVKYRTFFYTFSIILVVGSIVAMLSWGLNLSIDFKGGSLLEVSYSAGRPNQSIVQSAIVPLNISASVIPSGTNEYDIRTATLNDTQKNAVISALSQLALSASASITTSTTTSEAPNLKSQVPNNNQIPITNNQTG